MVAQTQIIYIMPEPNVFNEIIPLTLDILRDNRIYGEDHVFNYTEVHDFLTKEGYKDLGWLNSGIKLPNLPFECQFSNYTGSSTLMVNHEVRYMYSVDMGD